MHDASVHLTGHCNAGTTTCKQKGYYGVFKMWLNKNGIANLLSIPQLEQYGFVIDYNMKRNCIVTTPQGKEIVFRKDTGMCEGMPYIDIREHQEGVAMLETVQKNFEGYTKKQVENATLARKMQAMLAHPPYEKFKDTVSHKSLSNCRVRVDDITNAHAIFIPNHSILKGAKVRQKPERVDPKYTQIPRNLYELHKFVTLDADVMFVNDVQFLVTLSRDIRVFTAEFLPSLTAKQLSSLLNNIVKFYAHGGFVVRLVLMDMELKKSNTFLIKSR